MNRDLKTRLGKLRGSTGMVEVRQSAEPASVAERWSRATRARQRPAAGMSDQDLARRWRGEMTADGLVEIEHRVALPEPRALSLHQTLSGSLPNLPVAETEDWVCFDTETTGLAGGSGTLAFLVGLARPAGDALTVRQFLLTGFGGEAELLARAARWVGAASLISYNGRSFDAPLMSTRCRMNGQPDWIAGRAHLDLLHAVRRAFARGWSDCRLATVEQRLLGIARQDDLPGAEVPAAWFAYVREGDASRLGKVLDHNRQDVISLARLVPPLVDAYARPGQLRADVEAVAQSWLKHGEEERALTMLHGCAAELSDRGLHLLARLYRRAGRWAEAYRIWRRLAGGRDPGAIEHLAKYHEHVRGDAGAAMHWAGQLPCGATRDARVDRLLRKAAQSAPLPLDEL